MASLESDARTAAPADQNPEVTSGAQRAVDADNPRAVAGDDPNTTRNGDEPMADNRGESSANEEASRVRKVFLGEDPGPSTGNGVADDYERWLRREEHKIWKNHVPMLYDVMMSHQLTSPSLTVEWLPSAEQPEGEDYVVQKLLLGTRTANQEPNHLMLAEVRLPAADSSDNGSVDDEQDNDIVDDDSRVKFLLC